MTEQHGGQLKLEDAPARDGESRGATVKMVLPYVPLATDGVTERRSRPGDKDGASATVVT